MRRYQDRCATHFWTSTIICNISPEERDNYRLAACGPEKKSSLSIMGQFGNGSLSRFLRLIRFSHTIFALPFALGALIVAADGWPSLRIILLVIACMVFARTAAMLFNRLVDWSLDQRNPRTASRHLLVPKLSAVVLLIFSCAGFLLAASVINRLTCILAPVALALIFFYSVTKRFTSATHFFSRAGTCHCSSRRLDRSDRAL